MKQRAILLGAQIQEFVGGKRFVLSIHQDEAARKCVSTWVEELGREFDLPHSAFFELIHDLVRPWRQLHTCGFGLLVLGEPLEVCRCLDVEILECAGDGVCRGPVVPDDRDDWNCDEVRELEDRDCSLCFRSISGGWSSVLSGDSFVFRGGWREEGGEGERERKKPLGVFI